LKDSLVENAKKLEKSLENSNKPTGQEAITGEILKKRDEYFQKLFSNL
jgi:hypothetical protein